MKDSIFEDVLTNIGDGTPKLVCMAIGISLMLLIAPSTMVDSVKYEMGPNDLQFHLVSSYGTYVIIEPTSSTGDVHYQLVRDELNCGWRHFTPGCSAGFVISEDSYILFRGNGTIRFVLTYYESRP
jgi:hypothetical protein